jgi:hypothetical protein
MHALSVWMLDMINVATKKFVAARSQDGRAG